MNCDLKSLVKSNEESKTKYESEIKNLNSQNCDLRQQVASLKQVNQQNENLCLRLTLLHQRFEEVIKELVRLKNQNSIERQQQVADLMVRLRKTHMQVKNMKEKMNQYELLQSEVGLNVFVTKSVKISA